MLVTAKARTIKLKRKSTRKLAFNAQAFLDSASIARRIVAYRKSEKIYSPGHPAKNALYTQNGGTKLSVVNEFGKEAIFAILGPGDSFGKGCLAGQNVGMGTATAITPTTSLLGKKR